MPVIRISQEVFERIKSSQGVKQNPDMVLRKLYGLPLNGPTRGRPKSPLYLTLLNLEPNKIYTIDLLDKSKELSGPLFLEWRSKKIKSVLSLTKQIGDFYVDDSQFFKISVMKRLV